MSNKEYFKLLLTLKFKDMKTKKILNLILEKKPTFKAGEQYSMSTNFGGREIRRWTVIDGKGIFKNGAVIELHHLWGWTPSGSISPKEITLSMLDDADDTMLAALTDEGLELLKKEFNGQIQQIPVEFWEEKRRRELEKLSQ